MGFLFPLPHETEVIIEDFFDRMFAVTTLLMRYMIGMIYMSLPWLGLSLCEIYEKERSYNNECSTKKHRKAGILSII